MSDDKTLSKFLSLVLRHDPDAGNVSLDPAGWVAIESLLAGANQAGTTISAADLHRIAHQSDKKRFTISPDGMRIRAAQGHSVQVDLGVEPSMPPEKLWHGTAERTVTTILAEGLKPQTRQHVHLSPDYDTARTVGARHGKPVVLEVATGQAAHDGQLFWQADNGVWLSEPIAATYICIADDDTSPKTDIG